MQECVREGKRLVFHAHAGNHGAWARYMRRLVQTPGMKGDSYASMMRAARPAALRAWGRKHVHDYTPLFHTHISNAMQKSEQTVMWDDT